MDFVVFVEGESDNLPKFFKIYEDKIDFEPKNGDEGIYSVSIDF